MLTLADCLRHRLLCLTDVEISDGEGEGLGLVGFSPAELLQVGKHLRDFMLGLIGLAYPSRRPLSRELRTRMNLRSAMPEENSLHEALQRVQRKIDAQVYGSRPSFVSVDFPRRVKQLRWHFITNDC